MLDSCRYLQLQGADVTYLPVQTNGLVDLEEFEVWNLLHLCLCCCTPTAPSSSPAPPPLVRGKPVDRTQDGSILPLHTQFFSMFLTPSLLLRLPFDPIP